ncbi:D-amino acid dehydrogenase [Bartonella tamiae]|uniref:FAD dependent oxidoreductase domain-containing protein n=1 Tax=Bartonella tamiae Th239 TaxID=1094558 RepID=J0ZLP8_9HYPH|nr:D-amino acid dehydrogenase [Bartonella tamiae]EJF89348.1 hypothetical protein ME5_01899 [Bartonella tamiae Th239]EJF92787.1 hypothetical protein MEG_01957 [Bartonella tamiae Th307]
MKILILGSGVIGVTSAWYLNKAGHDVTVLDRQTGPALETSFANAGQVSFGYTTPWASPGLVIKALKWMMRPNSPLIIRPQANFRQISWLLSMLTNCNTQCYKDNKALMVRLSDYSAHCLKALREETHIPYDEGMKGTIQLFRDQAQFEAAHKDVEVLKADGIEFQMLNAQQCVEEEPGLFSLKKQITGGLQTPKDETGDCKIFTDKLAKMAQDKGVKFRYNVTIKKLHYAAQKISGVETSSGFETADAYLVCMGSFTPFLLSNVGLHAPIYPVKGYSITVPVTNAEHAPVSTVIDDSYKVAVTRLGDRIRVGGMAEVSDYKIKLSKQRMKTLQEALKMMFPKGYDQNYQPELWSGLRPVTPDSVPILGKTLFPNLYINSGHGTLGWTMSTGSAHFIADMISGKKTEIDPSGLDIQRYQ